jgi:AbiV family abortive infection protein
MTVTADFLLKGYALALEQCGLLLRDAVLLYKNKSYANAVVLAAFAREELGRSQILLGLWRRRLGGSPVTIGDIENACDNHVEKQKAGMLSTTMRADRNTGLGKTLTDRTTNPPQSQEFKDADATLNRIDKQTAKQTPTKRHSKRMRSLYVQPTLGSDWNRPADVSATDAHNFLQDAVNDYSGRYHQGYITSDQSILNNIDQELHDALDRLTDRPQLPPPEWPSLPTVLPTTTAPVGRFRGIVVVVFGVLTTVLAALTLLVIVVRR